MRTIPDWRDLPPIPRRPVPRGNGPEHRGHGAGKRKRNTTRNTFADLECRGDHARGETSTPGKRPRRNCDDLRDHPLSTRDVHVKSDSQPSCQPQLSTLPHAQLSHPANPVTASPVSDATTLDSDHDSGHQRPVRRVIRKRGRGRVVENAVLTTGSPVSGASVTAPNVSRFRDSRKPLLHTDNDISDEQVVLRVIRPQKPHVKPSHLDNSPARNTDPTHPTLEELFSPVSVRSAASAHDPQDSSDDEVIRRRRTPVKITHPSIPDSRSNTPSNPPSIDSTPNLTTPSRGTRRVRDDDSSDEEALSCSIRRRRRCKRASTSGSDEAQTRSSDRSPVRGDRRGSSIDDEDHSVSPRGPGKKRNASSPTVERRAKRRRVSLSEENDGGKQHKRRESSGMRPAKESEEHVSRHSSHDNESEMRPRKSCKYKAQRRRCARQSVTRPVGVPWYMLDEERKPYRLRSSSRNCAARCIYWTKTERRLFKVAKSQIHNRGLYALEDIPAFAPVIEYAGEVVTQVQSEIREWEYQSRHMDEVYMYQLHKGTTDVIDGTKRGGPAKFVNHSCEPNVVADEIKAGGTNRVWFFSLRPIRKHEEILVDYCLSYEPGDIKRPCMCGARKCKKYLNYYGLTE